MSRSIRRALAEIPARDRGLLAVGAVVLLVLAAGLFTAGVVVGSWL